MKESRIPRRASPREFASLVEHSPDIIRRFDRARRHLYVNPAARRLADRDPREWIGKTHEELGFPEEWRRRWDAALDRVFRTGEPAAGEFTMDAAGEPAVFEGRLIPEPAADGHVETVLTIARDITPVRQAEKRQRAAEELFRAIVEHSSQGFGLTDAGGVIRYQSPAAESLLGYRPEELAGRRWTDFVHPDDLERLQRHDLPGLLCRPGGVAQMRYRFRHGDGSWRFLEATVSNCLELKGVESLVMNYRDVSSEIEAQQARRRAENELTAQRTQALRADRLRSLGEMAAGIAHELNQPLGGIRALAEQNLIALRRKWNLDPDELARELQLLVEQADRMSRIINHVRLFARQAGKPEVQATDMNEVIEGSVGLMREQLRAHGISVALDLARPLPPVSVNPFSMEEVLLNLLSNARDATEAVHPDGTGTINLKSATTRFEGRTWVRVEVRDNGPGIAPDVLDRIFEPFFTTKAPDQGTGLGLSIARSIVESFGGRIRIEAQIGQGALAIVLLPAAGDGKAQP